MADKRAFAAFDVGYLDNPKIMDIFDASPIAVCMHFASVLYCAQHLTDGVIALRAMQRKVGGGSEDSDLLVDAGLWHLPGHDCPDCPDVPSGKAYVHDYLEHNRTSDGVKKKSNDGKRAAEARWEKKNADAERNATRMQGASETHSDSQYGNSQSAMHRQTDRQTEPEAKASGVPRKRGTRLDENFTVTDEMVQWARKNTPHVDGNIATQKFINYWTAKAGKDAIKLDWVKTWKNWMLTESTRNQPQGKPTVSDKMRNTLALDLDTPAQPTLRMISNDR